MLLDTKSFQDTYTKAIYMVYSINGTIIAVKEKNTFLYNIIRDFRDMVYNFKNGSAIKYPPQASVGYEFVGYTRIAYKCPNINMYVERVLKKEASSNISSI